LESSKESDNFDIFFGLGNRLAMPHTVWLFLEGFNKVYTVLK